MNKLGGSIEALKKEYLSSPCQSEITYNLHKLGTLINLVKEQRRKENDGYCYDSTDCDLYDALKTLGQIENDIQDVYNLIGSALKYDEMNTEEAALEKMRALCRRELYESDTYQLICINMEEKERLCGNFTK